MTAYTLDQFSRMIDHTNLHADATHADLRQLCNEAKQYHFKMVAINQVQSAFCAKQLAGTDIDVGAAIAFPLGQTSIAAKVFETKDALQNGANEIDYVINITALKEQQYSYLENEMRQIVAVCHAVNVPCKVILKPPISPSRKLSKWQLLLRTSVRILLRLRRALAQPVPLSKMWL